MVEWTHLKLKDGLKAKIDKRDVKKCSNHSWRIVQKKNSKRQTVVTTISTENGPRQLTLGKFLMKPPKGKLVYPRRGGLDYRRNNLIVCTMSERQRMLPKRVNQEASSQYKGVCWDNTRSKWRAELYIDGLCTCVGFFASESDAAFAYNKAAKKEFGDLAYKNQIIKRAGRRKQDR